MLPLSSFIFILNYLFPMPTTPLVSRVKFSPLKLNVPVGVSKNNPPVVSSSQHIYQLFYTVNVPPFSSKTPVPYNLCAVEPSLRVYVPPFIVKVPVIKANIPCVIPE